MVDAIDLGIDFHCLHAITCDTWHCNHAAQQNKQQPVARGLRLRRQSWPPDCGPSRRNHSAALEFLAKAGAVPHNKDAAGQDKGASRHCRSTAPPGGGAAACLYWPWRGADTGRARPGGCLMPFSPPCMRHWCLRENRSNLTTFSPGLIGSLLLMGTTRGARAVWVV